MKKARPESRSTGGLRARAARVRCLLLDVDGVLTDGTIFIHDDGSETKAFNIYDGHGVRMLLANGIRVGLITGRSSSVVAHRARDLGIRDVFQDVRDKLAVLTDLLARYELTLEEIAYVGDDVIDLPVLEKVGFAISVPGAPAIVRKKAHWVTQKPGGHGAVREVCDYLLDVRASLGAPTPTRARKKL